MSRFLNYIKTYHNLNFYIIGNKTDLNIRLDHQECKVVIQTWVKLITTIKMMVIRTCAEARDTSIEDVVANVEVVEI